MAVDNNADVAAKVRGIAAERRFRQVDMADTLKLSKMAIYRRMNGETPFSPEELIALARVLDTRVGAFFGEVAA